MKQYYSSIGMQRLCRLFGKSRQAAYDHAWRSSNSQMQEALIIDLVKQTRSILPKTGTIKLHIMTREQLRLHGITIGRDSFYRLLRKYELLIKRTKKYVRTTDSDHHYRRWPDLTSDTPLTAAEQLWVSDITYLRISSGFIYLSLITDAYSHKIVGYHLSQHLKASSCLIALDKAIAARTDTDQPLIHHSDRGIQYCCDLYVTRLLQNDISISMTQSGSPYDNAVAERVNGILKAELGLDRTFASYSQAVGVTHKAIDAYNRIRLHMSCANLTPQEAHLQKGVIKKLWKSKKQPVKLF
jgi:putative transposase